MEGVTPRVAGARGSKAVLVATSSLAVLANCLRGLAGGQNSGLFLA